MWRKGSGRSFPEEVLSLKLDEELKVLMDVILAAGDAVREIAEGGFETVHKPDQSPVTSADLKADEILRESLLRAFPGDGWLSEETHDDRKRLAKRRVWIVDPIDGTQEFVAGIPEFAISVALAEEGTPILAAVLNPMSGELFVGVQGEGVERNGVSVRAEHHLDERPVILASRSETRRGEFKCFEAFAQIRVVGSIAYKLALIAAGEADATFSRGPKNEWDIAAGALLVEEAGGRVRDGSGDSIRLNQRETRVDGIVAATSEAYDVACSLLHRIRGESNLNGETCR